jgi:hypothetical protein
MLAVLAMVGACGAPVVQAIPDGHGSKLIQLGN